MDFGYNEISVSHWNTFNDLQNLIDINLGHNKLIRIENGVFKFTPNLRGLLLDYNSLTFLPADVFRNLAHIQYLKLSHKLFSSPAESILGGILTPLVSNSLSSTKHGFNDYSKLSEIEPDSFHLPSTLSKLYLTIISYQFYTHMCLVISNLENLKYLNLSHNLLKSVLEDVFTGLTSLKFLDLIIC